MGASQHIREHRDEILRVAALHGAGNVLLFASVARGEDTPESDVDFLVDVTGDTTPWFPGSLTADLEQLLGQRVQVVIPRSLSPLIRDAVLREAVPLCNPSAPMPNISLGAFAESPRIPHPDGMPSLRREHCKTQSFATFRCCASRPNGSGSRTNSATPRSIGHR